jgi:Zn-dependent M28 family amino/carboxypeptidase
VGSAIEARRLRRHLDIIVGERSPFNGAQHLAEVEAFIENELASYGLAVESDYFPYRGRKFRNIIGRAAGHPSRPLIVLGAHLDAVEGTPGADDNASGLAVLLEAARVLTQARLHAPVLFCGFNLEEVGMIGSSYFVAKLSKTGVKIGGMISLEMVGYTDPRPGAQKYPAGLSWVYPDRGDFIGIIGNWNSSALLRAVARGMRQVRGLAVETLSVPGAGALLPAVRLSDHAPFWDAGYPALMVTDTAFYRNPNYHGRTDTLETLNVDFMAHVCEGVIRAIAAL